MYNYTKTELINAILRIAKEYNVESNYQALIDSRPGLPRLVEMISYEMFLNAFDYRSVSNELYNAYKAIKEYGCVLRNNGTVEFQREIDNTKLKALSTNDLLEMNHDMNHVIFNCWDKNGELVYNKRGITHFTSNKNGCEYVIRWSNLYDLLNGVVPINLHTGVTLVNSLDQLIDRLPGGTYGDATVGLYIEV